MKAKIKNGVVETEQVEHMHTPRIAWFYDQTGGHQLHQGQGAAEHVGRTASPPPACWAAIATGASFIPRNTFAQDGGQQGIREHEDHVSLYFALRRNADGMLTTPPPARMTASRRSIGIKLASAYVVDPENPKMEIPKLVLDEAAHAGLPRDQGQHHQGHRNPCAPAGAAGHDAKPPLGSFEHDIADLPSKDFFIKDAGPAALSPMRTSQRHSALDAPPPRARLPPAPATPPAAQPAKPGNQVQATRKPTEGGVRGDEMTTPAGDCCRPCAVHGVLALVRLHWRPSTRPCPIPSEVALSQEGDKGFVYRRFPGSQRLYYLRPGQGTAILHLRRNLHRRPARRSMPPRRPSRWGSGTAVRSARMAACNGPIAAIPIYTFFHDKPKRTLWRWRRTACGHILPYEK